MIYLVTALLPNTGYRCHLIDIICRHYIPLLYRDNVGSASVA